MTTRPPPFHLSLLFVFILCSVSLQVTAWQDDVWLNLECGSELRLEVDPSDRHVKLCITRYSLPVKPVRKKTPWGPVCGHLWAGDIGYWVEDRWHVCRGTPNALHRELLAPSRSVCTVLIDYHDKSKHPPLHRMEPVCDTEPDADGWYRVGFSVRQQQKPGFHCPPGLRHGKKLCEAKGWIVTAMGQTVNLASFLPSYKYKALPPPTWPHEAGPPAEVFSRFAVDGRIHVSLATFDYAGLAYAYYLWLQSVNLHAGWVMIAMDAPAYTYLQNRGVPSALMPSVVPLNPCCLHRWRMIPWRATNDVKTRAILLALRSGLEVVMYDLDVKLENPDRGGLPWEQLQDYDLVGAGGFSFMWTYSKPRPQVIKLWQTVYDNVKTGGWDQTQYGWWGQRMVDAGELKVRLGADDYLFKRSQNMEAERTQAFIQHSHADMVEMLDVAGVIMWHPYHDCHKLWGVPMLKVYWLRILACHEVLLMAAKVTGRLAIGNKKADINHRSLKMWFEYLPWQDAVAHRLVNTTIDPYESSATYPVVTDRDLYGNNAALPLPRLAHARDSSQSPGMVLLSVPDVDETSKHLRSMMPDEFLERLRQYVMPTPPGRLQHIQCLRAGGPVSDANPIPKCRLSDDPDRHPLFY